MPVVSPTYEPFLVYDSGKSAYWDTQTLSSGAVKVSTDPGTLKGSVVAVTYSRSEAVGVREDVAMWTLHMTVATGINSAWDSLTAADKVAVETILDALWTTIKVKIPAHYVLSSYVWRDFAADNPLGESGLSKPSVVNRITTRNVAGSDATGNQEDQVSCNVTFRTASRRHWGRSYLPGMGAGRLTGESRWVSADLDVIAGAFNTAFISMNGLARVVHPVVWSPKYRGFFSVETLAVDNVPDVIRSRRPKSATYIKTYT